MPSLKPHRGTVLYVQIVFDGQTGPGQVLLLPVFNLEVAGIKLTNFIMESGSDTPFGNVAHEMEQAVPRSCSLVISYPDATSLTTPSMPFGTMVAIGWSEQLLNAFGPTIDSDWRNNPAYITIDRHALIGLHGAMTRPQRPPPDVESKTGRVESAAKQSRRKR